MKVKELIELLSKIDGEKEVWLQVNGGEYHSSLEFLEVEEVDSGIVYLID
jgi:hypothetical protein